MTAEDEKASFHSKSDRTNSTSTDGNTTLTSPPTHPLSTSEAPTLNNPTNMDATTSASNSGSKDPTPTNQNPDHEGQAERNGPASTSASEEVITTLQEQERKSSILRPPLPPLPFHLREHKGAVIAISCVMLIDHGLFPPVCYFALKYATNLSLTTIFAIVTAVFGIVLGLESLIRAIKLILKNPKYRPLGQTARFGMDYWQLYFTLCLMINVACVTTGTSLTHPFINLLAMPMPLVIFNLSWHLLLFDFLHERKVKTPFRISSTPKGSIWPRFIYVIIEDVIAVDCNGKREWRQQWKDRVEASKPMRETLKRLSFYWGTSGLCVSALCLGLLWGFDSISGKQAGYALGWLLPWAWIIPSAIGTTAYVKHRLRDERHFCQRYRGSFAV